MTAVSGSGVVERFLHSMTCHEWDAMGSCLTDDVIRIGPYGDEYRGRDEYVEFIANLLPSLRGYVMELGRVLYVGSVATAQLSETVEVDGRPLRTPEALVFDLASDGRIARIEVYTQTLGFGPSSVT
jgi:ketosteroid isomerase-like protein